MTANPQPVQVEPPASQADPSLWQAVPSLPKIIAFINLNAISYQIAMGSPLVLLARHWGASALYIGAITSLVSLLSILQIFLANRLEYIGFKKVMLSGWAARNAVTIMTSLLPLCAGVLGHGWLLAILFALMFVFNTVRGLASSSWTPWLTYLVPVELRGRYMSIDQFMNSLSSALAFFLCGQILGNNADNIRYTIVLGISAAAGWASLYFLKNIPSPTLRRGTPPREPIWSWARRVWSDRAFRRLIRMNVVFALAMAAWEPFTTVFMRDAVHLSEGAIMWISGLKIFTAMPCAFIWGWLADRYNSRPVLSIATRVMLVMIVCWLLLSLKLMKSSFWLLTVLSVLLQGGWLGFNIANARYMMNNAPRAMPVLGLSLFSVIVSLSNALSPNLWGGTLDLLHEMNFAWGPLCIDRFVFFYTMMLVLMIVTKVLIRRLPEQAAAAPHVVLYSMINDLPLRAIQGVYRMFFPRSHDEENERDEV